MKTLILIVITAILAIWFPWIIFGIFYASFLEWNLHKHLMHTKRKWFPYPFRAHALVHHQIFKADETYHLQRNEDKHTIPMAWWNGIVLAIIASIPIAIIGYLIGDYQSWLKVGATVYGYYIVYESMHFLMHLPEDKQPWWFKKFYIFRDLDARHHLHHLHMNTKNFNVLVWFWDWVFGTYERPVLN